jgi:hypothetical protein
VGGGKNSALQELISSNVVTTTIKYKNESHENLHVIFPRLFIMLAIAKIDFATCLDSFIIVSGGPAWSSLNLFALSLSCFRCSLPCCTELGGRLSLQTATMLATIVMICVMFSPRVAGGVGLRIPLTTFWIAPMMASDWASR